MAQSSLADALSQKPRQNSVALAKALLEQSNFTLDQRVPRDPAYEYGSLLPFRKPKAGGPAEWNPAYSDAIASLWNTFTAPGRAIQGNADIGDALETGLSMMGVGGTIGPVVSKAGGPGTLSADVWHGSKHRMPPTERNPLGEFDPTKIGTGEGAQAIAHGHYVADRPETALGYKGEGGYMYKADLADEAIPRMLQWDVPISKQSQSVLDALLAHDDPVIRNAVSRDETGKRLYQALAQARMREIQADGFPAGVTRRVGGPEAASEFLRTLGMPGVRYLDKGSRYAGQGTSNYVVFPGEEKLLRILERTK